MLAAATFRAGNVGLLFRVGIHTHTPLHMYMDNKTLNVDTCGDYIHRHPRLDLPWRCYLEPPSGEQPRCTRIIVFGSWRTAAR